MTISSTTRKAGPYSGTGVQTVYPFNFKVFAPTDLLVVQTSAGGVETQLARTTDYTVALNPDQNFNPGGSITMLVAPPISSVLAIGSAIPLTQGQSIPNMGGFYPKVIENALDKLTAVLQQIVESVSRSLKFPFSDSANTTLPTAALRANTLLGFDAAGNATTYLPSSAGGLTALQMLLQGPNAYAITGIRSAKQLGVLGGGNASDTVALNAGIQAVSDAGGGLIVVNRGNYTGMGKIFMRSNVALVFEPGCLVKSAPGVFAVNDRFINFDSVSNCYFDGAHSTFAMNQGEYTAGEQRHIFFFVDAQDCEIKNVLAQDSGGDGFYFGRNAVGTHCKRIKWSGIRAIRARRNGASLVSIDGLTGHGFSFEDTAGAAPQYGIDFEPNDSDDEMRGIVMTGVRTSGNVGGGAIVALSNFGLTAKKTVGISVKGLTSTDDGNSTPNAASAGLSIAGASGFTMQNNVNGVVQFDDVLVVRPKGTAVRHTNLDATKGPTVRIRNVTVIDVASGAPVNNEDKCGLAIMGTNIGGRNFGNIDVENMKVYDTRGVTTTYSAVYIASIAGGTGVGIVQGMRLKDVMGVGFVPTSGRGHVANNAVDFDQSSITYTDEQTFASIATNDPIITKSFAGYTLLQTGGGTVQLPASNTNRGLSWFFNNVDGSTITVKPDAADTIREALTVGSSLILGVNGARARFTLAGSNRVQTDNMTPLANRPQGFIIPGRTVYGAAAPVAGAWTLPDIVINATPAIGNPGYWQNIAAGSPGTWAPVGIVGAIQCVRVGTTTAATLAALETNLNDLINKLITSKLMA